MNFEGAGKPNYAILIARFQGSAQWDRVLESACEWLSHEPELPRAHLAAGQALLNLDRPGEAETHLRQVLDRQPENDTALRLMSMALFRQKHYREADEAIHKAISLDPNDAYHWSHLAHMCYRQGDRKSAKEYAQRARELAPRNSDILNLLALCDSRRDTRKLQHYQEALELNPENAQVHNNIGVYYLNTAKDSHKAEEHFRRALFFGPSLKVARSNLFLSIKHRDIVYRALCAPRDFIIKLFAFMRDKRKKSMLLYILLLPVWLLAFRFVLAGLFLWFAFVWPLVKVYEFLTIGDIRARAGEIGARRGGILNYRQWPLRVRLFIFALLLLSFWGGLAYLWLKNISSTNEDEQVFLGLAVFAGLLLLLGFWLRTKFKKARARFHARRRTKRMGRLLEADTMKLERR